MGTYIYHLTTKSRRVKVGDQRVHVYLLAFAGKDTSRVDRWTKLRDARLSHLESAWGGRPFPKYVANGEFADGAEVYTDWPSTGVESSKFPSIAIIETPTLATFAGYLRADGARFRLEPWHRVQKVYETMDEAYAVLAAVRTFMGVKTLRHQITEVWEQSCRVQKLDIFCKDENDAPLIKLVM